MKRGTIVRFDYPIPPKPQFGEKELYGLVIGNSSVTDDITKEYKDVIWFSQKHLGARSIDTDYLEVISEGR